MLQIRQSRVNELNTCNGSWRKVFEEEYRCKEAGLGRSRQLFVEIFALTRFLQWRDLLHLLSSHNR